MTTLPYNGKIHLITGPLARLTKLHGVEPVRQALHYHQMTPAFYDAAVLQQRIEETQTQQPTQTYVS